MIRIVQKLLVLLRQVRDSILSTTLSFLMCLLCFQSCGGTTRPDANSGACGSVGLNSSLQRVLYWGWVSPGNVQPNIGLPFTDVWLPVWVEPQKLLVFTGTLVDGVSVRGIFEVFVNGASLEFESYVAYEFPHFIASLKYDDQRRQILVVYEEAGMSKAASVALLDGMVTIVEGLVGSEWRPVGISPWPGHDGFIFYGRNPDDDTWGYYWRSVDSTGVRVDSLIYAVDVSNGVGKGFSVSGSGDYLYFGEISGLRTTRVHRLRIDQGGSRTPEVMIEHEGRFICAQENPVNTSLLLVGFQFAGDGDTPPGSRVTLVTTDSLESRDLDIKTHGSVCRFTNLNSISWSPAGDHFAFSQGTIDGEGGVRPMELWIYRDAAP